MPSGKASVWRSNARDTFIQAMQIHSYMGNRLVPAGLQDPICLADSDP